MQSAISLNVDGNTLRGMQHWPDEAFLGKSIQSFPAIILFHGFTANKLQEHRLFLKISRRLCALGIASFRFDFSGSGESDGDFEEMTVRKEVQEAHAILDFVQSFPSIQRHRVMLLGLSMGGLVAGIVAGERPQDVERLILLSAAGNMRELIQAAMGEHPPERISPILYDRDGDLIGWDFYDDLMTIDGFACAQPYQGPVLVVHGTEDQAVPFAIAEQYCNEVFPGRSKLVPIEGADHTYNRLDWEQQVLDAIAAFVVEG